MVFHYIQSLNNAGKCNENGKDKKKEQKISERKIIAYKKKFVFFYDIWKYYVSISRLTCRKTIFDLFLNSTTPNSAKFFFFKALP
jgi:hypothetical protein